MTDKTDEVTVEGGLSQDNAILLLAAVEELEQDPSLVRTTLHGFVTTKEIADKAGLKSIDPNKEFDDEVEEARKAADADSEDHDHVAPVPAPPPTIDDEGNLVEVEAEPVKKAPAKKTAAKKTASSKE